jgi:indole-3-pyruvate monooxygenase
MVLSFLECTEEDVVMIAADSGAQGAIETDTLIIGAGPAGLAVGACLKQVEIPFLILEQSDQVAPAWHRHYDRLHLHTDKGHSSLPFLPLPREYPRYPSRMQVIEYLQDYARQFQLNPRFNQQVRTALRVHDHWEILTQDRIYLGANLVVAAGYNREAYSPNWPGMADFHGRILHSSQYKNGAPFRNQKVLVVGFGNSGGEIAIDLYEHGAQPALAVRSPVNVIPRELFGIPILTIGIAQSKLPPRLADALNAPILNVVIGDLTRYGLRKLPKGPLSQIQRDARIPLIDVGTIKLIKQGQVRVYPGIEAFTEEGVQFSDGNSQQFDSVILATGYRPRVGAFLNAATTYDENGTPFSSGEETSIPGLYFCGYYVSPTGMLREIALEAQHISRDIKNKYN